MAVPDDHAGADLDWTEKVERIQRIAKSVGKRKNASPPVRDELVCLSVELVFKKVKKGLFDPTRGRFEAWCRRVLERKCVDLIRQEATRRRYLENKEQQGETGDVVAEAPAFEGDAFPVVDWLAAFKQHLRPLPRIILAIDVELATAFPRATFVGWLREAGLPEAFPYEALEGVPQRERNRAMAAALVAVERPESREDLTVLNRKYNWVRQQIYRGQVALKTALARDEDGESVEPA